ncbi:hypothetical protein E8E13_006353 [Curvularia kusanoi]|uniref:Uncharacterized protein n=1 Tax=Curvularia kusanoi TaxID=90978 RepID=A0A9P4TDN3_CURKU|nr:hypothetical protein E8E13_006353 [Curvularia kusanoi]
MAQYKFKLKLDIPEIYPDNTLQQIRLRCHDSDGLYHCDCVKVRKHRGPERCCFFGRPIEPLAFYLPPYAEVQQQLQSPLYSLLPKEVRIAIFEFALADDNALTAGRDNIFRWQIGTDADVPKPDVAHALLQTCKAVYLETYRLPMQLNGELPFSAANCKASENLNLPHWSLISTITGYQSYRNRGRSRPNLERICPS